jgi:hypothetical protein
LSGQGNKTSKRGALTCWWEGLVRTEKESQQARDTHSLSSIVRGTRQVSERKLESESHSLSVKRRGECHQDSERKPASGETHVLSSAERGSRLSSKRDPASEKHSLSVERREMDASGQQKKAGEGHSLSVEQRGRDKSGQRNKASR